MTPDAQATLIAVLVIALVVVAIIVFAAQRRRSTMLRGRFGPEYDRTVQTTGDPRLAERELSERERRRKKLDIRPLPDSMRDKVTSDWKAAQAQFVDDPRGALGNADALLRQVMDARGYPTGDFEQQAADLSVDYASVIGDYRKAHVIVANASRSSTEDLRSAMVIYRSLFDRLVADRVPREAVSRG